MTELWEWGKKSLARQVAALTILAMVHSLKYRGWWNTLLFAAPGFVLPGLAEYYAVYTSQKIRHLTHPQVRGVPVGAICSWYVITYATFSAVDSLARGGSPLQSRLLIPAVTSLTATSLDLVLDCFALDVGMWEWKENGMYARDIQGPNGKRGIPLINFAGWIGLTAGVSAIYVLITADRGMRNKSTACESGRLASLLLIPYYLPAAIWAIWRGKPRYLLYSGAFPLVLWRAIRGAGQR